MSFGISGVEGEKKSYRADIDGLRGIAVSLVVAYHAFPHLIPGGFVGVDIFFVISGYVITRLLARKAGSETTFKFFSDFYAKRVRRIFPAAMLVLIFVLASGYLFLDPDTLTSVAAYGLGATLFVPNFVAYAHAGYFDLESTRNPLIHFWSLGVEEQFYFVWPFVFLMSLRLKASPLWTAVLLGGMSFMLNVASVRELPDFAFYLPATRAWELMAGAALAERQSASIRLAGPLAWIAGPSTPARIAAVQNLASVVGLTMIAVAVFGFRPGDAFPGWWAVLPTGGAALLIDSRAAWLARVLLPSRPMTALGRVSYPLYLWHYPLLVGLGA